MRRRRRIVGRIEVLLIEHRPDPLCLQCIASTLAINDAAVQRAALFLEGMPALRAAGHGVREVQQAADGAAGDVSPDQRVGESSENARLISRRRDTARARAVTWWVDGTPEPGDWPVFAFAAEAPVARPP